MTNAKHLVVVPFQLRSDKVNFKTNELHKAGSDMWAVMYVPKRAAFNYCYATQSDAEIARSNMLHIARDLKDDNVNFKLGVDHCIPTTLTKLFE